MIPETCLVHLDAPECFDLRATALRPPGGAWHVFVTTGDSPYWLAVMESQRLPRLHLDSETAAFWAKASLLLGEEWDVCIEDIADTLAFQYRALDSIGPKIRSRLMRSTPEQISEWREQVERTESGLLLWASMTNTDPRAAAN